MISPVLQPFLQGFERTDRLEHDVPRFLRLHGCPNTAEHCIRVGREAAKQAARFGVDPQLAQAAGLLHDISAVFPNDRRVDAAIRLGLDVLPEEETFPMIVHQKISAAMAAELFGVTSGQVLSAVGCHTTLKASSSPLDMVLFVADKIEWDQTGTPPFLDKLLGGLDISLAHGTFSYLEYMWERRDQLKVVHPWLAEAYRELARKLGRPASDDTRYDSKDKE
ncbi:bis(5'-nucleosyl)-tetraphosphatase (symmetrical) YqeK [Paenibacillus hamazuiensis]|uniref:bis(5'-nucleosyl)-tetraphosphatase (symmetrical) YqeK n=1 Tax=Paenibacillus hamazuiensis TaxID=2936508 RepID=UPI00200CB7E6|nr:bis(5'-nucleosyl)-tetraphosphatase (symmetrical) YqeK [Paenibacillus hamazuiensis]